LHYYVVTGASSGLGKETARLLLRPGHHVVSISRREPIGLVTQANQTGGRFTWLEQDLSNIGELPGCVDRLMQLIAASGTPALSMHLIHNAAAAAPFKALDHHSPEEISASLNVNVHAPVLLSSLWIQRIRPLRIPKQLIVITSASADYPMAGMSLYCSAKAGLNMMVRCLQLEQRGLPYGVRIAAVDPGMMDTPMQVAAREAHELSFPAAAFFRQSRENGQLRTPDSVARRLVEWMSDLSVRPEAESGTVHKL